VLDVGTLPIRIEGKEVWFLDQRALPARVEYFKANDLESTCFAIKEMVIRGAPSIGVAAAFALAKDAINHADKVASIYALLDRLKFSRQQLEKTRPTAVNLFWATSAIFALAERDVAEIPGLSPTQLSRILWQRAEALLEEHIEHNRVLSEYGAKLVSENAAILTHCNAGSLAACGWGTALGVIRSAHFAGLKPQVYVDETRPRNQGGKITVWELERDGIPVTLICDSVAPYLMSQKKIDLIIVGADRIALNGDTANKVGTYMLALSAFHHQIPFYVAAPSSTIDRSIAGGAEIAIEERNQKELTHCGDVLLTTPAAQALNLAFDVTPAAFISAIITEQGVLAPPFEKTIAKLSQSALNGNNLRTAGV
jgi:methylthioribose-1-phosphate isomerase